MLQIEIVAVWRLLTTQRHTLTDLSPIFNLHRHDRNNHGHSSQTAAVSYLFHIHVHRCVDCAGGFEIVMRHCTLSCMDTRDPFHHFHVESSNKLRVTKYACLGSTDRIYWDAICTISRSDYRCGACHPRCCDCRGSVVLPTSGWNEGHSEEVCHRHSLLLQSADA